MRWWPARASNLFLAPGGAEDGFPAIAWLGTRLAVGALALQPFTNGQAGKLGQFHFTRLFSLVFQQRAQCGEGYLHNP